MKTTLRGVRALALAALLTAGLAACAVLREPAYDPAIASAVSELAVESEDLFAALRAEPPEPFPARAPLYRRLAARAGTVRTMAETRLPGALIPAGSGSLGALAGLMLAARANPEAPDAAYAEATPAMMADYLRNLDWLRTADEGAPAGPPPTIRRLRIAALTEILRDVLIYERRILRRGR